MTEYQNKVQMLYTIDELEKLKNNCEEDKGEYRSDLLLMYSKQEKIEDPLFEDKGEYRSDLLNHYLVQELVTIDHYTANNFNSLSFKKNNKFEKDIEDAILVPCTNYISLYDDNDYL